MTDTPTSKTFDPLRQDLVTLDTVGKNNKPRLFTYHLSFFGVFGINIRFFISELTLLRLSKIKDGVVLLVFILVFLMLAIFLVSLTPISRG